MYWANRKNKCASTKVDTKWIQTLLGDQKGHAHQPVEMYQILFKERIEPVVEAAVEGFKDKSKRMSIRKAEVAKMWENEGMEVCRQVTKALDKEKEERGKRGIKIVSHHDQRTP